MTDATHGPVGSPEEGEPTGPGSRETPMTSTGDQHDDQTDPLKQGDDAFGGAVGDKLPGGETESGDTAAGDMPESPFTPEEAAAQEASLDAQKARESAEHPDTVLAAERLADLQRLQAEYVNYKKRVDRDKAGLKDLGVGTVLEALMPVLDEVTLAKQHGDLEDGTPFARIADKLTGVLGRFGLEQFGEAGEEFDPTRHEALMHVEADLPEGATTTTVVQVLQPGYRQGERVLRAARVSVADPQ